MTLDEQGKALLERAEAALSKASPGPWKHEKDMVRGISDMKAVFQADAGADDGEGVGIAWQRGVDNAAFVCEARNLLPDIAAYLQMRDMLDVGRSRQQKPAPGVSDEYQIVARQLRHIADGIEQGHYRLSSFTDETRMEKESGYKAGVVTRRVVHLFMDLNLERSDAQ